MNRTSPQDRPKYQKIDLEKLSQDELLTVMKACSLEVNVHQMLLTAITQEFYDRVVIT